MAFIPNEPNIEFPNAKPGKAAYSRNLPHIQREGATIFATYATRNRWILPESTRSAVMSHCLHDNGIKADFHAVVVMPDHVHVLFTPRNDAEGTVYSLREILGGIKGASAHTVNRMLNRAGHVWQEESFDHLLRSDESMQEKAEYICANPVRKGLVERTSDYPWLWKAWKE